MTAEKGYHDSRPGHRFVRPAKEGLKVAMPNVLRQYLPAEGAWVPEDGYWLRRISKAEVVACDPPAEAEAGPAARAAAKKAEKE